MIGMQYKITLPSDYNMEIIKNRVQENGHKTDGFEDLLFKCYLIKEKGISSFENAYAPLYIWKDSKGMNKFIFDGYYDNILKSFGWQSIQLGVPLLVELEESFHQSKYMAEISHQILPDSSLAGFRDMVSNFPGQDENTTGRVCLYHPEQWKYSMFTFYQEKPRNLSDFYSILHISQ